MIKYSVEYQQLAKGRHRPSDNGEIVGIKATDESGLVIIPNIGDFVQIDECKDRAGCMGKVKSRAFFYSWTSDEQLCCHVNIVVEETDDDWGKLIKV